MIALPADAVRGDHDQMSVVAGDEAGVGHRPGRERLARTLAWPALLLPALTLALHLANAGTPVHTWWFGFVVIDRKA